MRCWCSRPAATRRQSFERRTFERVLARYGRDHALSPQTTLDELGLSSLDRIEFALDVEQQLGIGVSEAAMAESRTVGDLHPRDR